MGPRRRHPGRSFPKVAAMMAEAKTDVLAFTSFPKGHWQKIWSNNPIERLNKEIKRRADVVEIFPNPAAFLRLATAVGHRSPRRMAGHPPLPLRCLHGRTYGQSSPPNTAAAALAKQHQIT